jgi:hypothetical protein
MFLNTHRKYPHIGYDEEVYGDEDEMWYDEYKGEKLYLSTGQFSSAMHVQGSFDRSINEEVWRRVLYGYKSVGPGGVWKEGYDAMELI